jgi:hypothetical protein
MQRQKYFYLAIALYQLTFQPLQKVRLLSTLFIELPL